MQESKNIKQMIYLEQCYDGNGSLFPLTLHRATPHVCHPNCLRHRRQSCGSLNILFAVTICKGNFLTNLLSLQTPTLGPRPGSALAAWKQRSKYFQFKIRNWGSMAMQCRHANNVWRYLMMLYNTRSAKCLNVLPIQRKMLFRHLLRISNIV